jgi:hypothetical protein
MRILAGGDVRRSRAAAALLVGGAVLVAAGIGWAIAEAFL